jgi:hypothetical protein
MQDLVKQFLIKDYLNLLTEIEGTAYGTFEIRRVSFFADNFVIAESSVHRINICF